MYNYIPQMTANGGNCVAIPKSVFKSQCCIYDKDNEYHRTGWSVDSINEG